MKVRDEPPEISDLIREIRSRQNLTQEELAARLGVTFPTINRWENGRSKPSRMGLRLVRDELQQLGYSDLLSKYFPN